MFVDFNTFVDLKVVVLRIKTSNKFKTFGPNNGMSRPVYIDIGVAVDGTEHGMSVACDPDCLRRMGVTRADTQRC